MPQRTDKDRLIDFSNALLKDYDDARARVINMPIEEVNKNLDALSEQVKTLVEEDCKTVHADLTKQIMDLGGKVEASVGVKHATEANPYDARITISYKPATGGNAIFAVKAAKNGRYEPDMEAVKKEVSSIMDRLLNNILKELKQSAAKNGLKQWIATAGYDWNNVGIADRYFFVDESGKLYTIDTNSHGTDRYVHPEDLNKQVKLAGYAFINNTDNGYGYSTHTAAYNLNSNLVDPKELGLEDKSDSYSNGSSYIRTYTNRQEANKVERSYQFSDRFGMNFFAKEHSTYDCGD